MTDDKRAADLAQDKATEKIDLDQIESHWMRDYRRGLLQLMVLLIIKTQTENAHGYGLIKVIREAGIHIKAGTIYPLLKRLGDVKLIEAITAADDLDEPLVQRKIYIITPAGELMIDRMMEIYGKYNAFVDELYQDILRKKRR